MPTILGLVIGAVIAIILFLAVLFVTDDGVLAATAVILVAVITLVGVGVYMSGKQTERERASFMSECRQDHKQYECDVLWGQAQGGSTTVVPMPVIVSH